MLIYLLAYTVFGLAVITFSSPAQFQGRRPGRLVLSKDSLSWRGPAGQGSLMDALEWLKQDARWVLAHLWQPAARPVRARGHGQHTAKAGDSTIALADIASTTAVDRRAFGYLLTRFLLHGAGAKATRNGDRADPRLDRSLRRAVRRAGAAHASPAQTLWRRFYSQRMGHLLSADAALHASRWPRCCRWRRRGSTGRCCWITRC